MRLLNSLFDPTQSAGLRGVRAALIGLLIAACGYRVWLVFHFNPVFHIWSDPARHWEQGIDVLRSDPMSMIDPILYQLYIGMLAKLTLKIPVLVAYWTSLLSLLGPWLWYRFLRELLPSRDWALAGWVLLAALPSWSVIYCYFMQETLMLPLLGAALWLSWRARRKADVASFMLAAFVWLLAGFTRGICLPLGMVALSWLWLSQPGKLARFAASLTLLAVCVGPLAYRSYHSAGLIAPNGISGLVQLYQRSGALTVIADFERQGARWGYGFTSPSILRPPFEPFSDWQSQRSGEFHFSVNMDAGSRDWDAAKKTLTPWNIDRAVWLTGENLIHLFFSQSWPDTNREWDIGNINHWLRWLWAPLAALCLVVTLWRWRVERERLLPALLLTWFIVQGLFPLAVNEGRYRKPFEGLLIVQCLLLAAGSRATRRPACADTVLTPPTIIRDA